MARMSIAEVRRRLAAETQTTEGMTRFLDHLLGPGNYVYDPDEDVWVTPDIHHTGPGRGYVVIKRGGSWFKAVLPGDTVA